MKKIDLPELISKTSEQDSKRIRQLTVRELEAEKPNFYVAFVDEGQDSYDVNIELDKIEILAHSCDCPSTETYCLHKKAVAAELVKMDPKAKAKKVAVARKKKRSPLEELIDEQDMADVRSWLLGFLSENKQAATAFKLAFEQQRASYSLLEVTGKIDEVMSSVLGRKRKAIPAPEIKNIVDLWEKALVPILEYIELNVASKEATELFHGLGRHIYSCSFRISTTSKRIFGFLQKLVVRYAGFVNKLKSDADWQVLAAPLYLKFVSSSARDWVVDDCAIQIYIGASADRKGWIAELVKETILKSDFMAAKFHSSILLNITAILEDSNLLFDCIHLFTPIPYADDYNRWLIRLLSAYDPEQALVYCEKILNDGLTERLDISFPLLLVQLYEYLGQYEKLLAMRAAMFSSSSSLDEYIKTVESVPAGVALDNFKIEVVESLCRDYDGMELLLHILNYEEDWARAIDVLHKNVAIPEFWDYKDRLYAADRTKLLSILLHQGHRTAEYYQNFQPVLFQEVPAFVEKNYTYEEIKKFAPPRGYSKGTFSEYIIKRVLKELF